MGFFDNLFRVVRRSAEETAKEELLRAAGRVIGRSLPELLRARDAIGFAVRTAELLGEAHEANEANGGPPAEERLEHLRAEVQLALDPSEERSRVCLDPGHGYKRGRPTGARSSNVVEDDVALAVCHKVRWYLLSRKVDVTMTRRDVGFVSLSSRVKAANREESGAFISVHCNAAASAQAHGAEVFHAGPDTHSLELADRLLGVLVKHGMKSRGIKPDTAAAVGRLYVLRNNYLIRPAVLVELGFLTNPQDRSRLASRAWLEPVCSEMAEQIE